MARARSQALADFWRGLATIDGKAQALGQYAVLEGGYQRLFEAPHAYETVTADDIRKLATSCYDRAIALSVSHSGNSGCSPGRRPMRTIVAALLFFCSTCVLAAGNGVKVPQFERVQLPNGTVVLLTERHDVPLIAFSAVLRGGAVSDPRRWLGSCESSGGTAAEGSGLARRRAIRRDGRVGCGQIEAAASTESISVSGSFLARDQQLMVDLVADMLAAATT
jgi:predicted Zn-dependent peptidase